MQYVDFGKTGLRVSRVGLGGIPLQRGTAEDTVALVKASREAGINYIDTARAYTVSEAWLGAALEQLDARKDFVLATKAVFTTADEMRAALETSLRDLRTDYIDLYQFHNPSMAGLDTILAPGGAMEVLLEAKAKGVIGHIGLTAHLAAVAERALEIPEIETIMFPYNIVEEQGAEIVARCQAAGKAFIAMKPLAGGAIEDGTLAMRYLMSDAGVTVAIPGMATVEEVAQNTAVADKTQPLNEAEQAACAAVRAQLGSNFCRRCNYCAPCTVGISIPSVFLFQGYLDRYDLAGWAKDRYATLAVKAGACIECGACEPRCPYNLPIREMLKKAAAGFGE